MNSIAIDGPAGAGKSTIARQVAKELGFIYVDTGALYRVLALHVINSAMDPADNTAVGDILNDALISVTYEDGIQHVHLNGEDVSESIRSPEVSLTASRIAAYREVRDKLLSMQRDIAEKNDIIMDGRDIGTVVLPDADLKIYLTASVEERARRRFLEMQKKGEDISLESIKEDIIKRDKADMEREIAPLKQADDALLIDSSDMSVDEVVKSIVMLAKEACK